MTLAISNWLGQEVKRLVDQDQVAGDYAVSWDGNDQYGSNLSSGIFIFRLQAGAFVACKKLALVR